MRIVFLNANYNSDVVGGGQRSLRFLAEGVAAQGHDVRVVSVGPRDLRERVGGVEHIRVAHANLYWTFDGASHGTLARAGWHALDAFNPFVARAIEPHVVGFAPDVVHTNVMAGISPAVWRAFARRGLPIVHTLRDYYVLCARSEMFRDGRTCERTCLDCRPFTAPARALSDRVDAVVGNSRYILDRHLALGAFPTAAVRRVVYNGVEPPANPPARMPSPDGRLRLGYLGRLDVPKGVDWLLEAFARLPVGRFTLDVAGSGEPAYEHSLRSRYASEEVRFLGYTDPAELFRRIDLLVVPSLWPEPLPRTAFEAYAHGVPVLGAARGGIPEAIDDGRSGHVFDPDRFETFANPLIRLADDRIALDDLTRGAAAAAAKFRPERVVHEYLAIYDEVLGRGRQQRSAGAKSLHGN